MAKRAMRKSVPRSEASNAFELLNDVVEIIREEPSRLYMPWWLVRGLKELNSALGRRPKPSCGTAACLAGWIVVLHDGVGEAAALQRSDQIASRAREILGVDVNRLGFLFAADVKENGRELSAGTRPYVDAVIDRLRLFQGRNEAALRAQRVTPIGRKRS